MTVRLAFATLLLAGGGLVAPALGTRAADPEITSARYTGSVTVDGSTADWPRLERVGTGPAVAAENDGAALYLAVASNDATVREQLATGLIVWLDASGRKAQTVGIRLEGLTRRPLPGETPAADPRDDRRSFQRRLTAFDRLGPARNQRRLVDDPGAAGVELASGVEEGTVVYEMKIPLQASPATPHAAGAGPGATIALGLETPAAPGGPRDRNRLDDPMNTNPWVFNPYGGYFNPPPPPSGSRPPKEPEPIKPMKLFWVLVRLAR